MVGETALQTLAERQAKDTNLNELRTEMTRHLAIFLIAASAVAFWFELARSVRPTEALLPWVTLVAVGIIVFLLNTISPLSARYLLMIGLGGGLILEMYLFPELWIPFLALPIIFVGAVLISHSEWFLAFGIGTVAIYYHHLGAREYPLPEMLLTLMGGTLLAWLAVKSLYTALEWAWTAQCRAVELLERSRDHQGELNRALKSLEQSYAFQSRMQRELYFARKQAEEAKRMKERFAANISHELRTPLNLILGFSELMYLSPEIYGEMVWQPALRRDIHHIYRSSRHLLEMIDDILDLSRLDLAEFALTKELTPLEPLLRGVVEMTHDMFQLKSVDLNLDIEGPLPALEIDRTRIRQVILNLLNNAQRFTDRGRVTLYASQQDGEIRISVRDTGPGIPADKLDHIFDEFYQVDHSLRRRHEGAGLGLAICKRFVEAHQGRVWAESQEGDGSTFFITLPVADRPPLPAVAPRPVEPQWPEDHPPVLVVDPDPRVGTLIERHLPSCEMIQIRDRAALGQAALDHHPRAVILNHPPDTDLPIPETLSLPIPIIECSLPSYSWLAHDLKVMACLNKPILAQDFLTEVEQAGELRSVLIVDDDRGFCHLIERILRRKHDALAIRSAYSGEEGLTELLIDPPDLLILDLIMPEMDGVRLLDQMHRDAILRDIPVILLTASSYTEEMWTQEKSQLIIRRPGGLFPLEVLRCLQSVIDIVEPKYDVDMSPETIPTNNRVVKEVRPPSS